MTGEAQQKERRRSFPELFGTGGDTVWMQPPFFRDYGPNILLGERVFFNFNCIVLDVCPVTVGDYTLVGSAVQVYTAMLPMNVICGERNLPSRSKLAPTCGSAGEQLFAPAFGSVRGRWSVPAVW